LQAAHRAAPQTILAYQALKHFGLEPGKDVQVLPMGGSGAGRLAVLEQGVVDASLLSVPENVLALHKGYNELIFLGDVLSFPQNGFGTSTSRIQQQPEEVYRMVRAALRGLLFVTDDGNRDDRARYYDEAMAHQRRQTRR
jgi:ABC-type nitrate/sulfonate/bicarbonate transport system substrate-binding protein